MGEDNFRFSLHGGHDDADAAAATADNDDNDDDDTIAKDHRRLYNVKKELNKWKDKAKKVENRANDLQNHVNHLNNQINGLNNQVNSLNNQVNHYVDKANNLQNEVNELKNTNLNIAKGLEDVIVKPILSKLEQAQEDLQEVNNIANTVADGTVDAIKSIDVLPKDGNALANYLSTAMLDFLPQDNCIPYDCLANKMGVDISDIELYSSDNLSISTAVTPVTCLELTSIEFDVDKLGEFLDLFRDLEALDGIYDSVTEYLKEEMGKIIKFMDDIGDLMEDIRDVAKDAGQALGLNRRRRLTVTEDGEPVSMEHVAAIAYEKGTARFKELYGEHVSRVFQERNLGQNAGSYIGFKALEFQLTQDFNQRFTLEAQGRAGFAGSVFDESVKKSINFAVPGTFGMVNIPMSGSMEASMPYAMSMEASATAEFGYDMGQTTVAVDVLSGITSSKQPFSTNLEVEARGAVSATMALNFASSTSMGICLGPDKNACVTVTVDLSQSSAAGFDALAGVGLDTNSLTTVYTDVLEYDEKVCDGTMILNAGYWQYFEDPSMTVAVATTGDGGCSSTSDILFELEGGIAQQSIDNTCVAI